MAGLGVIFLGVVSAVHAEMEVKVKDNTANNGFSIKEDTTGSTIARFRGDGKVGIGTTSPDRKLTLDDSSYPLLSFRVNGVENGYIGWHYSLNRYQISTPGNLSITAGNAGGEQPNVLFINNSGNVGIGTTNPLYKLDINGSIAVGSLDQNTFVHVRTNDVAYSTTIKNPTSPTTKAQSFISMLQKDSLAVGDTNQIRLGFIANDNGGSPEKRFFTAIEAVVEDPNNTTKKAGLRFMPCPAGEHFETERMRITGDGNVGIGYTSPSYKLDVNGTIRGSNVSPSDMRWKDNVKTLDNSLEKVNKLRGVSFEWKDKTKGTGTQVGLIAQEVETVFPEVVSEDNEGYKSVAYDKLVGVLVESIKELKTQKDAEIAALKAEIEALKASLSNNVRVVAQ